jgi:hypothetical protein
LQKIIWKLQEFVSIATMNREHLKVADSSKGWMAAYMLQAVPKNIFATLRCSPMNPLNQQLLNNRWFSLGEASRHRYFAFWAEVILGDIG